MKIEFKVKLLRYLGLKSGFRNSETGFTLIELLVVIVIIGILSAIALPSFLGQAAKAQQSTAKIYVGSMNRAQQSYYLENSEFAPTVDVLGLGIPTQTKTYEFTIETNTTGTDIFTLGQGKSLKKHLKPYVGMVGLLIGNGEEHPVMPAILCEADQPALGLAPTPVYGVVLSCGPASHVIDK